MTDISQWIANGGKVKKGRTKRAKGAEDILWYSLPPNIKARKSRPIPIPMHMGTKGDGMYWLNNSETTNENTIDGTTKG